MAEQVIISTPTDNILITKLDFLISFVDKMDINDNTTNISIEQKQSENVSKKEDKKKSIFTDPNKKKSEFRNYEDNPRQKGVEQFYKTQHENVTYEFVLSQREKYLKFDKCTMTIWDMLHYLDQIVDESDPDTDLSQLEHALQTAESSRKAYPDEKYDWLHVTALIHDLGKVLSVKDDKLGFIGEPQWCTVGDIFPVGCKFSEKNVYYEYFENNPDYNDSRYNTKYGIYSEKCGLDNILLSWGHDEYLYNICKHQSKLPFEALCMIRYHSFYPWHTGGDYMYLCNDKDINIALKWTKIFNTFDLYSKSHDLPKFEQVASYYKEKIEKYFPNPVKW